MRPEIVPHLHFQDRHAAGRAQTSAVNDADAPVEVVAADFETLLHGRARGCCRHAVEVAPVRGGVLAACELPDLAPIDAMRGEVLT